VSPRLRSPRVAGVWSPEARRLLKEPNYAALATCGDVGPSCHMMWVDADDDFLYLNTELHRAKYARLALGASLAVMVFENSRSWVEIVGTVAEHETGPGARAHLERLAFKYNGHGYQKQIISERVLVTVRPDREYVYVPSSSRRMDTPRWR
jgi:uncharacterized pyridoxamine 5'-phosphate oxidase family protein